jgi:membrane protein
MLERLRNSRVARVAGALGDRYADDAGGYLAAAIAYYGFLSLFPLLLLGLSVVGFVLAGNPGLRREVADGLASAVPGVESLVGRNLEVLIESRAGAGIIGLATLLWTGTGVVGAGRNALLRIFREERIRSGIRLKAWLLGVTVGLGLLALAATGLATLAAGLDARGPFGVLFRVLGVAAAVALDVALFLATYRVLLRRRRPWGALLPGALFAALAWAVLKVVGTWYAEYSVSSSRSVYGTFAATVGVLVLLYLAGRVFVYGAELNAVLIEEGGGGPMEREHGNGGSEPGKRPGEPQDRSTVQLVGQVAGDVGTLVKKEVQLARQEVTEAVMARLKAVGALGVAGVIGLFALGFGAAAGAAGLALVVPVWAALLIVAGGFLLLALVALVFARARMRRPSLQPERAKQSIKEDVEWAKAQLRRGGRSRRSGTGSTRTCGNWSVGSPSRPCGPSAWWGSSWEPAWGSSSSGRFSGGGSRRRLSRATGGCWSARRI